MGVPFSKNKKQAHEGGYPGISDEYSKEFLGFFKAEPLGEIFLNGISLGKPFMSGS